MDFLGSPALAEIHVFVYTGSSFSQTQHMGTVLVGCWGMPGVGAAVAQGDEQDNTQAEPSADQTRCLLSSQQPRSLSLARHALGTGMQKPLSQGRLKETVFQHGHFSLTLSFFSRC